MTESVLDKVRQRAYDEAGALPAVALRPVDTVGHVLREDLFARHDLPGHDVVTVDGWAVAGPGPWQLVTASPPEAGVPDGAAVAVAAGDELPPGTSAVVSRHDATIVDGRLHASTNLGEHVRGQGSELAEGALLIPRGTLMTAGAAALAAIGGNENVLVTGRPEVSLLVTYGSGNPVATAAAEAVLPSLLLSAGATSVSSRRIPDTSVSLRSTIDAVHADVVVVTGATADQRARHLDNVLTDSRAEVVVDGARDTTSIVGTSSWLLAHLRDGRLLLALPGDLRSALAATVALARPLIHGLSGYALEPPESRTLDGEVAGAGDRSRFVFVRGDRPTPDVGPATGHGVANADALALVPPTGANLYTALQVLPLR